MKRYKRIQKSNYSLYLKKIRNKNNNESMEFLKEILKKEYNIIEYTIIKNNNGKKYLKNINLFFNISHKNDMLVIGVSHSEIGIDIECLKDIYIKNKNVLKYFYTEEEEKNIKNNIDLLTLWTKKESYIKLIGGKLSDIINLDLDKINVNQNTIYLGRYIITISQF